MFNNRKIRKLINGLVQSSVILSAYPTLEVHEDIETALGLDFIGNLMEDHYTAIANDPVIMEGIKKSLVDRTNNFVDQLTEIVISEGIVSYCKDMVCEECGASLYRIGGRYFCKACFDKKCKETYFEDRRKDSEYKLIKEGDRDNTEEVPVVPEGTGGTKDLDPNLFG